MTINGTSNCNTKLLIKQIYIRLPLNNTNTIFSTRAPNISLISAAYTSFIKYKWAIHSHPNFMQFYKHGNQDLKYND